MDNSIPSLNDVPNSYTYWQYCPMTGGSFIFIPVEILNERQLFGKTQYEIRAFDGDGSCWVKEEYIHDEASKEVAKAVSRKFKEKYGYSLNDSGY
jgi:hypothetical protein